MGTNQVYIGWTNEVVGTGANKLRLVVDVTKFNYDWPIAATVAPAGAANNSVLYNNNTVIAGSSNIVVDQSTWSLSVAGNITAYSSDGRLKENVVTINNALAKLKQIRGVYYDWKAIVDGLGFHPVDRSDIGVIAQEVGKIIPQAIKPAPFDTKDGASISGENYITVQIEKIIPLLIEAIKELSDQVDDLKKKIQ